MSIGDIKLRYVRSLADVEEMLGWLGERREFLAVDTETTGLNVGRDRVRLCQFGDGRMGWALDFKWWAGVCKQAIESYDRPMVCHNLLYDSKMLKQEGIILPQKLAHDSMVMVWLANPAGKMGLKAAAVKYVDRRAAAGQSALREVFAATGWNWATVPTELPVYWQYAALDTCLTALLAEQLHPQTGGGPYRRAYETELGAIHCLREAELAGMLTDPEYRRRCTDKLRAEIEELRVQIPCSNPNADRQVIALLHQLGARWEIYTEKGNLSVDKHVLKMLAKAGFPLAMLIAKYRSRTKLLNSYMEKLAELAVDDVVYANTKPLAAVTGRMSVTDPPLQTLPRGRVVRDAFVARPGHVFVMADFVGMEMRALAAMAHEQTMLEAFGRGEDLHDFVARSLYGESFTKQQRSTCKNAGFAKVYGAGVPTFAATAEIGVAEAGEFLQQYDGMFPGVAQFMGRVSVEIVRRAGGTKRGSGYVTLVDGRRIPVEAADSYKGVNYLIQGSTAITTKEKIVELDAAGLGTYFRLAVHDELILEVPVEEADEARAVLQRVMPDRHNFPGVTLEIDSDTVTRWGQHYREDFPAYIPTEDSEWTSAAA